MTDKAERLGVGHFRVNGQEIKFAPVEGATFEWTRIEHQTELTDLEEKKVKALGYDRDKVLQVKACLERGMTKMGIHKLTSIARSTIDNYLKIMSKKDMKIH
ncbi:hypothetical protein [Aureispira sp. CCB-QB1]|uniref:hypothetical protein n=1 Tax=Aureispira sp. CCB-QB1 TaxID=1313421 RepID=UPI00069800A4|nr:hypothetical protein [Aureispira sp. CCB-QB1]